MPKNLSRSLFLATALLLLIAVAWFARHLSAERRVESLLADLSGTDRDAASAAADELSKLTSPSLISLVVSRYGDPDSDDSRAVAAVLVHIGEPAVKPLIVDLRRLPWGWYQARESVPPPALKPADIARKTGLADILAKIGEPAIAPLVQLADAATDSFISSAAIEALGKIGAPALDDLLTLLNSGRDDLRGYAARALFQTRDQRAALPLVAILNNRRERPALRATIAWVLGRFPCLEAFDALAAAAKDTSSEVRLSVMTGLSGQTDPRAADILLAALDDRDPDVRAAVAYGLGEKKDPRALAPLASLALNDSYIRDPAVEALRKIGPASVLDSFRAALNEGPRERRQNAAVALEVLSGPSARADVDAFLGDVDPAKVADDCDSWIAKGTPGTEWILIIALERCGDLGTARKLLLCDNPVLRNAANYWLRRNNLTLPDEPSFIPLQWGSASRPQSQR